MKESERIESNTSVSSGEGGDGKVSGGRRLGHISYHIICHIHTLVVGAHSLIACARICVWNYGDPFITSFVIHPCLFWNHISSHKRLTSSRG